MTLAAISIFITVFLGIWAAIHSYVFLRLGSIPWIQAHCSVRAQIITAVILWLSYPLSRTLVRYVPAAWPLEFAAAIWMGIVFLIFSAFLVVDIITLGGFVFQSIVPAARTAACLVALVLSAVGIIQGMRAPVLTDYEISMPGLPPDKDGLTVIQITDLHLGNLIGKRWLGNLVNRINDLKPDLVLAVGDIVDGEADGLRPVVPVLKELRAPLGVWAVTGNHEFYVGRHRSVELLQAAGYKVLQDQWAEVTPGLILAGVDDIGTRREGPQPIVKALENRPPGATIFLCHTPSFAEVAAASGASLMVCGHTHKGQIWPFTYLVQARFKLLAGRYDVNGMPVLVCRGTGTWGPRMRLWEPGEIIRIKLRSASKI